MKIGVLTWARNINYGGVLQALAVRHCLENFGHSVELINYDPLQANLSYSRLWRFTKHRRLNSFLGVCLDLVLHCILNGYFIVSVIRLYRSRLFIQKYVRLSKTHYPDYAAICKQTEYPLVVVGSDQVWNPKFFMGKPAYLLGGMRKGVRLVSYAASVAVTHVDDALPYFKEALPRYAGVSLRERSTIAELQPYVNSKIEWVVDPTLLMTADEWCRLLDLSDRKTEPYICVYWLSDIDKIVPELVTLVKRTGLNIHLYSNIDSFRIKTLSWNAVVEHIKIRLKMAMTPRIHFHKAADAKMFLEGLRSSCGVITDSFHAVMFSTIFSKRIRVVIPEERRQMASRITDFLAMSVSREEDVLSESIGLPTAIIDRARLDGWIENSRHWLAEQCKENV